VAGAGQGLVKLFACGVAARRLRVALLAGTALTLLASPVAAQTAQTWNGNSSTDWFTGTNWDSTTVPATGDSATLDTVTPNPTVVDGTAGGYSPVDLSGLNVGFIGTGSLAIKNGASVTISNNNFVIGGDLSGVATSANGTVVLDASSLSVTGTPATSGTIFVGASGTGSFTVQNGATVSTVDSYVGHLLGTTGTVTVTGAGTTWTNSDGGGNGQNIVGNEGNGTFNVLNGAMVTVEAGTIVGASPTGTGTINISGIGSTWTASNITLLGGNTLSDGGHGTINVSDGGSYVAHNQVVIGFKDGGTGQFNVTSGATVTVDNNAIVNLGLFPGATGTLTISGAGSLWDASAGGDMYVGGNPGGFAPAGGTGIVNVLDGGALNMQGAIYLGRGSSGGNGTLNVSGVGSSVSLTTASDSLFIGYTGIGALNISGGAQVTNDGYAYVGYAQGSLGTVTIDGAGSTWTSNGPVTVIGGNDFSGPGGTGVVTVRNGGTFNTNDAALGLDTTELAAGTVNVTGVGSTWNAANIYVGYSGTGAINIADGGVVNSSGSMSIGECACSSGTASVSGGSKLNVGSDLYVGNFGNGTMIVSGQGTNVSVGGGLFVGLAATGALTVQDGASVTASDAILGFNPGASLGTVNVTGAGSKLTISNSLVVGYGFDGGVLTILDGGLVDVGNGVTSDGRITVGAGSVMNAGSFSLSGTATTTFGLRGSSSGQINLGSGTATLDGALVVTGRNIARTTYTLIHSASLGGSAFSTVTYDPLLRNPVLTYTTGDVLLTVDAMLLSSLLPNYANTNQRNVAQAIDNVMNSGATPPSGFENLYFMSGDGLLGALTQMSGEIGTTPTQAAFTATNQFVDILNGQGGSAFGGGSFGATSYAAEKKLDPKAAEAYAAVTPRDRRAPAPDFTLRWGVWASGYGGSATVKGDAGTGSTDSTSRVYGMAAGAQYTFSRDTVAGFALGGAGTNFGVNGGSGRADVFQAGAYARHHFGAAYVAGALAYGWQRVTTNRTVTVSGTDKLEASFDAQTFAARLEGGYRFATPWAGLTPYGALQSTSIFLPSYAEGAVSGSNQFALSYGSQNTTNLRTELGLRVDKSFVLADGVFALNGRAAWAHDSNTDRSATPTFQTLPGATFTVNGAKPAANGALLSAGAKMVWANGFSVSANFDGEFSNTTASYAGRGTVAYTW